jgi:hypothetical protein
VVWIRTDELDDALDNLEMVAFFLEALPPQRKWKWASIALHQALYGFAICATTPSNSSFALQDPTNPNSHLVSIWTALERAKDPDWMLRTHSKPLRTTPDEDQAICKLVREFRNEFAHFRPKGWSIEVSGMPTLLRYVLRVIEHFALAADAITYYDETSPERAEKAIARVRSALQRLAAT